MAGTYDLMDIVALKVIERSTFLLSFAIRYNNIKNAINGKRSIGTVKLVVKKQF